jgi:hypothetical protein
LATSLPGGIGPGWATARARIPCSMVDITMEDSQGSKCFGARRHFCRALGRVGTGLRAGLLTHPSRRRSWNVAL